jgi:uncharacterized protein (TIGR00296 family)
MSRRTSQNGPITSSPLFVTWNKRPSPNSSYTLRGCIGTFESQPLPDGLASYALTSALYDTRFRPMTGPELPNLEVCVTLLTDFETCTQGPLDWEVGVHGIKISFYERNRRYSATYLPDVAVEQGWDREETLESLVRKAGYSGRKGWKELEMDVVRYQGRKESVEWEEYKEWREWVVANGRNTAA